MEPLFLSVQQKLDRLNTVLQENIADVRLGVLNGIMEESISSQKMVKAFRRNESVIETFRLHNQKVFEAGVYANTYALLLMPFTSVLGNLFVILLAGFGGWLALLTQS